ncbi:YlbF family regulator [Sporosarcina sp. Marseille-Q4063]|uniref:YlbF family regulator n=1 Tax=Sporosarcina sp. Marseille-Q4063 TaxID=2810514 RepID=UPI001BAFF079|nr:YlbF family regulator [Sporosarcina sp. Marseille-Q4063]QUW23456.1 YlbF family regulator [Sporosarcina sp. Marseille-Q4063]
MTVNIYDDLNRLEATFRKTTEFSEVQQAVAVVKADEDALALFKNFRKIQLDLQEKQMAGEEVEADELEYAQKTAQLAQSNEKIMAMLEAEMKLSGLIEEVNRVLMKPVQEIYESI